MTRDDLRGIIEGITDEQLKKILDINSADIGKVKTDLETVKGNLETANGKIADYEKEIGTLKESIGNTEEMQKHLNTSLRHRYMIRVYQYGLILDIGESYLYNKVRIQKIKEENRNGKEDRVFILIRRRCY